MTKQTKPAVDHHLPALLLGSEPPGHLRVIEVPDDALSSKFRRGDRAVVDVKDHSLREGYIACDFFSDGIVQFFRLQVTFNAEHPYRLLTDNPHYIPQDLTRERLLEGLIGRVVGAMIRIPS